MASSILFLICSLCYAFGSEETLSLKEQEEGYVVSGSVRFKLAFHNGSSYGRDMTNQERRSLYSQTTVSLDGKGTQKIELVQKDGKFKFTNVEPGPYVLQAHSTQFHFPSIRVDVSQKNAGKVRGKMSLTGQSVPHPFIIQPIMEMNYFEERRPLGLMNLILQNKMIWFVGVMMLMMAGMQKMMSNPELMKEIRGEAPEQLKAESILGRILPRVKND